MYKTKTKKNTLLNYVPEEILREVLLNLPSKSLCRFLTVCKSWHTLITSQPFIHSHLNQNKQNQRNTHLLLRVNVDDDEDFIFYPYNQANGTIFGVPSLVLKPPPKYIADRRLYYIIGICNGLVCLLSDYSRRSCGIFILWNPSIRKFVTLPPCISPQKSVKMVVYGFGLNLSNNDYKVVRINVFLERDMTSTLATSMVVQVCSLRTREWRTINGGNNNIPTPFHSHHVFMNGRCHWFASKIGETSSLILSFDMSDEMLREVVSLPKKILEQRMTHSIRLTTISREIECIAIAWRVEEPNGMRSCQIWVMNEYGVSESWNNLYNIDMGMDMGLWRHRFNWFLGVKNGGILEINSTQVTFNDLEDGSSMDLNKLEELARLSYADKYLESLVLL